jgi:hypothetical protein
MLSDLANEKLIAPFLSNAVIRRKPKLGCGQKRGLFCGSGGHGPARSQVLR